MRTLVKIGLVFPLVALLAFTFAVAEVPEEDKTELNQDLNRDLNSRVVIDQDRTQTADDEDENGTNVQAAGASGLRRGIAQRRSNRSGRGQMANGTAHSDRWWRGSSGSSGGSSGSGKSDSGDSGKSASPTDPSSESS